MAMVGRFRIQRQDPYHTSGSEEKDGLVIFKVPTITLVVVMFRRSAVTVRLDNKDRMYTRVYDRSQQLSTIFQTCSCDARQQMEMAMRSLMVIHLCR